MGDLGDFGPAADLGGLICHNTNIILVFGGLLTFDPNQEKPKTDDSIDEHSDWCLFRGTITTHPTQIQKLGWKTFLWKTALWFCFCVLVRSGLRT